MMKEKVLKWLHNINSLVCIVACCIVIGVFVKECTYNDYSHNECIVNVNPQKNIE